MPPSDAYLPKGKGITLKKDRGSVITEKKIEIAMKTRRRNQNVFAEAPDLSGGFQTARFPKSPVVKATIRKVREGWSESPLDAAIALPSNANSTLYSQI